MSLFTTYYVIIVELTDPARVIVLETSVGSGVCWSLLPYGQWRLGRKGQFMGY